MSAVYGTNAVAESIGQNWSGNGQGKFNCKSKFDTVIGYLKPFRLIESLASFLNNISKIIHNCMYVYILNSVFILYFILKDSRTLM